jgi:hypothetical protein
MKNSDKPAMPMDGEFYIDPYKPEKGTECYLGLTKREMFAMHAMQALATNTGYHKWDLLAEDAVAIADALLKELEK